MQCWSALTISASFPVSRNHFPTSTTIKLFLSRAKRNLLQSYHAMILYGVLSLAWHGVTELLTREIHYDMICRCVTRYLAKRRNLTLRKVVSVFCDAVRYVFSWHASLRFTLYPDGQCESLLLRATRLSNKKKNVKTFFPIRSRRHVLHVVKRDPCVESDVASSAAWLH